MSIPLVGVGLEFTPAQPGVIYAVAESLYTVEPAGALAVVVGSLCLGQVDGLALRPPEMTLHGIRTSPSSSTLCCIDHCTCGASSLVTVPVGNMRAIAFSPSGTLLGATKEGLLLRINPETGDTARIGSSAGIVYSSLSFSPSGQLYGSVQPPLFNKDAIYTVDTTDGSTTLVGKTGDNLATLSIAFNARGELFGLKGTSPQENTLVMIDPATGAGSEIGPLGVSGLQAIIVRTDIVESSGSEGRELPLEYALRPNYPNPFNPATTIEFALPRSGYIMLKVYNILGEKVETLLARDHAAGTFTVTWDAAGMPSGVYFYRLIAEEFVQTRKAVLMR